MTKRILLATGNGKKLSELRRIIEEYEMDIEVISLKDIDAYPEPDETEWTFEGNALIKARQGMLHSDLPSLADDSGLCVDALGHMPGVRSSRWNGPEQEDIANLELVLRQIDDVPRGRRQAQFVSVMALVMPNGKEFTTRGEMTGHLTTRPKGARGFGYDPIFVPDEQLPDSHGRLRTTAEMSAAEKDAISHRGRSVRAMLPILARQLGLPVPEGLAEDDLDLPGSDRQGPAPDMPPSEWTAAIPVIPRPDAAQPESPAQPGSAAQPSSPSTPVEH